MVVTGSPEDGGGAAGGAPPQGLGLREGIDLALGKEVGERGGGRQPPTPKP